MRITKTWYATNDCNNGHGLAYSLDNGRRYTVELPEFPNAYTHNMLTLEIKKTIRLLRKIYLYD